MVGLVITLTTIVFGLVEWMRAKRENNKVSAWLSGAWTFSIFFTSVIGSALATLAARFISSSIDS